MNTVFYVDENCKWIHIYSLSWSSNHQKNQEQLPIANDRSVRSDFKIAEYMKNLIITKHDELFQLQKQFHRACQITTCLLIDIKLPSRISKLIILEAIPNSISLVCQPSIRDLIVERRLHDKREMLVLICQFPNVKYLKLLFPVEKCLFLSCLNNLFSLDNGIEKKYFI
ncbi:unnamed protein product [Rotaria sp. Silwood2]|nr:unnamed protein product [Rotaria sp. Silwood2]CAF3409846.1 unnamed protein product [Rotaria sp. Silwood2]CAF4495027.1 unnamed protein product [Rotaria sp. Silwood2]